MLPFSLRAASCLGGAMLLLAACPPPVTDDDDTTPEPCDNAGPAILVQEIADEQPVGVPVEVIAQVTDDDGVSTVSLYYMTEGSMGFAFTFMSNEGTGDSSIYVADIPASIVDSPAVQFYVRATDVVSGGCQEESFFPESGEDAPGSFSVALDQFQLPYTEHFDSEGDCDTEGSELDDLGWAVSIQSFPQGIHAWRVDDRSPLSGNCSASHSEGIPGGYWDCPPPDGTGTIVRKNWLISPPLDFSGKTDIAVRWFEKHATAGPCAEVHQLYVSTGSPDPVAEQFELVEADLPFPGSAWSSSAWYDLSAYVGSEEVYVALYYEGGAAGRWQVDDLYVGQPLADVVLDEIPTLDPSVVPGSSNVELAVTLRNASDVFSTTALTATLTSSDTGIAVVGAGGSFPPMEPGATAAGDNVFLIDIASSHPDNAYLDFALGLDDGAGHTWTVPVRLLLGQESSFVLEYTAGAGHPLTFELGHGPIVAPNFGTTSDSEMLAGASWTLAITDHAAVLPPGPGLSRWALTVTNDGHLPADVTSATFTVGGVDIVADASDLPVTLQPGESIVVAIPPSPKLVVEATTTTPDPAVPGGTVTVDSVVLRNDGYPTSGAVGCILGSSDADASNFSTAPVTFGSTLIGSGESRSADGGFSFDIAASHVDNSPITLTLLCTDGADTLAISFDLDVPYAHPVTQSVRIDDSSTGNDDGLADPNETVSLYLTALNDGAFDTSVPLTATYSAGTGSTASFLLGGSGQLTFGAAPLAAAASTESAESIELSIDGSALLGDTMVIDVVYSAGSDTWSETIVVDVTGLPWLPCPYDDDAQGDNVGGAPFDIKGCSYRSDGVLLQVKLDSYTSFTPAQAFVDFFFYELPAIYSIESVGGNAYLESGCVFGTDITTVSVPVSVDVSSGESAIARVATADLGILGNNTQVAFGTDSCPGIYFCDYYPSTSLSFNLVEGTYNCDGNSFIHLNW